jgi:hypothetical protein
MAVDIVFCPYCNAQVLLPAERPNSRIPCPRCGEMVPYQTMQPASAPDNSAAALGSLSADSLPPPMVPEAPRRWSNGAVAGLVVAIMLAMLVFSFTLAQLTVDVRRAHDLLRPERRPSLTLPLVVLIGFFVYLAFLLTYLVRLLTGPNRPQALGARIGLRVLIVVLGLVGLQNLVWIGMKISVLLGWSVAPAPNPPLPDEVPSAIHSVTPADLPGLGYLPPRTSVVAAIHVAEALQQPGGRDFLTQGRFPGIRLKVADIPGLIGLKVEDIDHLVFGARLDDEPLALVVVETRRPYDAAQLRSRLHATPAGTRGNKTLDRFQSEQLPLQLALWCATPNTLVVALNPSNLDGVPVNPATGINHLPDAVQTLLRREMGPGTQAWLAGHVENWKALELLQTLPGIQLPREEVSLLTQLRTFGIWVQLGPPLKLTQEFDCADASGAQAVEKYLVRRKPEDLESLKILGSSPAAEAVARELARTLKTERTGTRVIMQATASTGALQP